MAKNSFLKDITQRIKKARYGDDRPEGVFAGYEDRTPSAQNSVDLFEGWNGAFPYEMGLVAGSVPLFHDARISWALEQLGSIEGLSVLELGPLEGAHTYMLQRAGAGEIISVEAHKEAYLRCLIAKEIYELERTKFLLGDFVKYLENTDRQFDLILASGVLYHMKDPMVLIELIAQRAEKVILWTHFFDEEAMPKDDLRRVPFSEDVVERPFMDTNIRLHARSYYNAWKANSFCGGPENSHYWMEKDQIVGMFRALGFTKIQIGLEDLSHQNGPCFAVCLQKT